LITIACFFSFLEARGKIEVTKVKGRGYFKGGRGRRKGRAIRKSNRVVNRIKVHYMYI
jgi:hypothetical protein